MSSILELCNQVKGILDRCVLIEREIKNCLSFQIEIIERTRGKVASNLSRFFERQLVRKYIFYPFSSLELQLNKLHFTLNFFSPSVG